MTRFALVTLFLASLSLNVYLLIFAGIVSVRIGM